MWGRRISPNPSISCIRWLGTTLYGGFQLGKWGYPKKSLDGFCERDNPIVRNRSKWMMTGGGYPYDKTEPPGQSQAMQS